MTDRIVEAQQAPEPTDVNFEKIVVGQTNDGLPVIALDGDLPPVSVTEVSPLPFLRRTANANDVDALEKERKDEEEATNV